MGGRGARRADRERLRVARRAAEGSTAALDLLERHWRPLATWADASFVCAVEEAPSLAMRLRDVPSLRASAIEMLAWPAEALADRMGALPFARRLRAVVIQQSIAERVGRDEASEITRRRYEAARGHLLFWEHGAVVVAHALRNASLSPGVTRDLAEIWFQLDRPSARAWVACRVREAIRFYIDALATSPPATRLRLGAARAPFVRYESSPMRPIGSVFIATSLDGFIARPDGRIDWLSVVERPAKTTATSASSRRSTRW